ncbi:hypothetical protein [Pseudoduganella sp.]|uniref:hypothetical protein n=1 Tax=Pseudoduganella sp. TaxID=1880898 RepID=UPI0035AF7288
MLERLDVLVAWTNMPARVKHDMNHGDDGQRQHLPMRWLPLLLMAAAAGVVAATLMLPVSYWLFGTVGAFSAAAAAVYTHGPLGKPSIEDDERGAALRKDAWLFSLSVLAFANIIGQPALLMAAALHGWSVERVSYVVLAVFICNVIWLNCLRTLYTSWKHSGRAHA